MRLPLPRTRRFNPLGAMFTSVMIRKKTTLIRWPWLAVRVITVSLAAAAIAACSDTDRSGAPVRYEVSV